MGYNNPCPLPSLLPWVDLTPFRGTSSLFGVSIAQSIGGLYRSIWHCGPLRRQTTLTAFSNYKFGCDINGLFFTYTQGSTAYPRISSHTAPSTSMNASLVSAIYPTSRAGKRIVRFINYNKVVADFFSDDTFTYYSSSSTTTTNTAYFSRYRSNYFLESSEMGPNLFSAYTTADEIKTTRIQKLIAINNTATADSNWQKLPIMRCIPDVGGSTTDSVKYFRPIFFKMSRPLPVAPQLIENCTSVDYVTIGGRTYHSQHSQRKLWQCELLLDGALDENYQNQGLLATDGVFWGDSLDCETGWDVFLKFAEKGVTLLVDDSIGIGRHIRPSFAAAFPGTPNVISGQLVNCSKLTLKQANNLNRRYSVTLTIAEEDPY